MRRPHRAVVIGMLMVAATAGCTEPNNADSAPVVFDAYLGETAAGKNAALYLRIDQTGGNDRLVGITTDVSDIVGMMPATIDMEDAFTDRSVDVPLSAGGGVTFAPGEDHLMVIDVTRELEVGDDVQVTLTFERHDPVVVTASTLSLLDINERAADALEEADS